MTNRFVLGVLFAASCATTVPPGSVGLWNSLPDEIAKATGAGVFLYSRAGYGKSPPGQLPRSTSFLDEEACEVLPRVLDAIGFQRGLLLGHSDGASIAAIHCLVASVLGDRDRLDPAGEFVK